MIENVDHRSLFKFFIPERRINFRIFFEFSPFFTFYPVFLSGQYVISTVSNICINHIMNRDTSQGKKVTIEQVTTIPAIPKNALFPGHNHLLTTDTDEPRF